MPIAMCLFCQYVGSGEDQYDQWNDVEEHEKREHPDEVKEHYGEA